MYRFIMSLLELVSGAKVSKNTLVAPTRKGESLLTQKKLPERVMLLAQEKCF